MIHETVGTISTLGTKVSPPSTSKTLLENNSNVANFSIGSFPREEERSQATPNVIHETVMSSATASSSKSLVGNESEVEKSMSITDDSFGGSLPPKERTDFRRPKTPLEFLSKTPRASMNKSQLKPTMEIGKKHALMNMTSPIDYFGGNITPVFYIKKSYVKLEFKNS